MGKGQEGSVCVYMVCQIGTGVWGLLAFKVSAVKFITHHREALAALAGRTHSIEIRLEGKRPVRYLSLEKQRSLASDHLDWK